MDRELARKRPAQIVTSTARVSADIRTLPRREVIERTFHQRQELVREVQRMAKRQEIGTTYRIREIPGGWRAEVIRIREPGRRWKPWVFGVGLLAAATGLLWLAVLALQAIAAVLPYVFGGLVLLAILAALVAVSSRGGISVSQSVNIK